MSLLNLSLLVNASDYACVSYAYAAYALEEDEQFSLIHIDGGHREDEILNDIRLCRRFAQPGETLLLVDDATW